MTNEFNNLLEDYDKLTEDVSKSQTEEHTQVNESEVEQDSKKEVEETAIPEEALNEEVNNEPNKETAKKEAEEQTEKTYKGSEEMSEGLGTDVQETQGEDVSVEESPEADEVQNAEVVERTTDLEQEEKDKEAEESSKEDDKTVEKEPKDENVSKSLTDEDILKGFRTVLNSLSAVSEEREKLVTRDELNQLAKSLEVINEKLTVLTGEKTEKTYDSTDAEGAKEPEEKESEEEVTQKSFDGVTSTVTNGEEAYVSKSIEGAEESVDYAVSDDSDDNVENKDDIDYALLRENFMTNFKKESQLKNKPHVQLNALRDTYTRVMNNPTNANPQDVKMLKDFAGM